MCYKKHHYNNRITKENPVILSFIKLQPHHFSFQRLIKFHDIFIICYDLHYHSNLPQVLANTVFLTISTSEMLSKLSTWTSTPTGIAGPANRGESRLLTDIDRQLIHDKTCFPPQCISPLSVRKLFHQGLVWLQLREQLRKCK